MRRTRIALAATAVPLALLLAGCSGGSDTTATDTSSSSSESGSADDTGADDTGADDSGTEDSGTEDSGSEDSNADEASAGDSLTAEELAAILQDGNTNDEPMSYTMSIKSAELKQDTVMKGSMDPGADPIEMQFSMQIATRKIEMRIVDNALYMSMAPKQWVKTAYDPKEMADQDPTAQMESFAEGVSSATFVGEETLDGETVKHYTAKLDPKSSAGSDLGGKATMDLFLDDEGRVTLMKLDSKSAEMVFDFYDFGKPVNVEAPPASQVLSQ